MKMKRSLITTALIAVAVLTSCSAASNSAFVESSPEMRITEAQTEMNTSVSENESTWNPEAVTSETEAAMMDDLVLEIEGVRIPVIWEENESVEALKDLCRAEPLMIDLSMYGGFEQVGPLGQDLPADDAQLTTQSGDIVLYSGDQIVLFYGSNSWSYTSLGRMDLSEEELIDLLGYEDVRIVISIT